jgi:hypothetical protein
MKMMKKFLMFMTVVLCIMMSCGGGGYVGKYSKSYLKSQGLTSEQIKNLKLLFDDEWKHYNFIWNTLKSMDLSKEQMWISYKDYVDEMIRYYRAKNAKLNGKECYEAIGNYDTVYLRGKGLSATQVDEIREYFLDNWNSVNRSTNDDGEHLAVSLEIMWISSQMSIDKMIKDYQAKNLGSKEVAEYRDAVIRLIEADGINNQAEYKDKITPNLIKLPELFKKYGVKVPNYIFAQILLYTRHKVDEGNGALLDNYNYFGFTGDVLGNDSASGIDDLGNYKYANLENFVKAIVAYQTLFEADDFEFTDANYLEYLKGTYNEDYVKWVYNVASVAIDMWDPNYDWSQLKVEGNQSNNQANNADETGTRVEDIDKLPGWAQVPSAFKRHNIMFPNVVVKQMYYTLRTSKIKGVMFIAKTGNNYLLFSQYDIAEELSTNSIGSSACYGYSSFDDFVADIATYQLDKGIYNLDSEEEYYDFLTGVKGKEFSDGVRSQSTPVAKMSY